MEIYIAIPIPRLPEAAAIESAAVAAGLTLSIASLDWSNQSGFLPLTMGGHSSGVEVDVAEGAECVDFLEESKFPIPAKLVIVRWGSEMVECACALAFAAAVAQSGPGIIFDPESCSVLHPTGVFQEASACLEDAQ